MYVYLDCKYDINILNNLFYEYGQQNRKISNAIKIFEKLSKIIDKTVFLNKKEHIINNKKIIDIIYEIAKDNLSIKELECFSEIENYLNTIKMLDGFDTKSKIAIFVLCFAKLCDFLLYKIQIQHYKNRRLDEFISDSKLDEKLIDYIFCNAMEINKFEKRTYILDNIFFQDYVAVKAFYNNLDINMYYEANCRELLAELFCDEKQTILCKTSFNNPDIIIYERLFNELFIKDK